LDAKGIGSSEVIVRGPRFTFVISHKTPRRM
jgi:hypothetical protein